MTYENSDCIVRISLGIRCLRRTRLAEGEAEELAVADFLCLDLLHLVWNQVEKAINGVGAGIDKLCLLYTSRCV